MRLTRQLAAPPARVWRALTDPTLIGQWFGPEGFSCQTKEIDLRVGGQWRFDMIGPDGTIWPNRHRYTTMEPPRFLQFLMDGDDDSAPPMEVTAELAPEGTGTRLVWTVLFPTSDAREAAVSFGADRLGQQTLAKLDALSASLPD